VRSQGLESWDAGRQIIHELMVDVIWRRLEDDMKREMAAEASQYSSTSRTKEECDSIAKDVVESAQSRMQLRVQAIMESMHYQRQSQ
jgi:hypothetical protein